MRASTGRGRGWELAIGAFTAASALAFAPNAAWALSADLSAQFRSVREIIPLVRPDGTVVDTTITTQFWTQTFAIRHARRLGSTTTLSSEFNWSDHYYVGRTYRDQSPAGRIAVNDPRFGLLASYQPSRTRSSATLISGFQQAGGAVNPATVLASQQWLIVGSLSLPSLPRVDLSWQRSHRDALANSAQQSSVARTARISHAIGPVSLRAGYSDIARGEASVRSPYQTVWDAQAGFGVSPRPNMSFGSQYSFSSFRRGEHGAFQDRTTNQGVSVSGGYRPQAGLAVDLSYAFRHNDLGGRQRLTTEDHNGSMALTYTPTPLASFGFAGALRTDPGLGRRNVARALVGSARFGGHVRPSWTADAGATHSWSWARAQSGVTQDNLSARTRFAVRKGLELNADWQLSVSGVAGARGERDVTTATVGFSAHPVRTLDVSGATGSYAAGPSLGRADSRARTRSLSGQWRPRRTLAIQAGISQTGAQPNNRPRTDTQRYDVRWQPTASLQLSTVYTRSNVAQTGAYTTQLTGQESVASRLSLGLGRSVVVSGGFSISDPGAARESRQYDASVTRTFGR